MLAQLLGATRHVWNWALERRSRAYREAGESLNWVALSRELTAYRRREDRPWLSALPREPFNQVLRNQERAFAVFFAKRSAYPAFKRKGGPAAVRFTLNQRRQQARDGGGRWARISLPGVGELKVRRTEPLVGRLRSVTLRRDGAGRWFAALTGIRNPVSLKVGPSVTPDQLMRVIDALNPHDEPGRLSLIHRMGVGQIAEKLPPLLEAVRREGRRVLWVSDPMHGNTESTSNGYKTRRFDNIRSEVEQAFDLHAAAGTRLGGVHLELTGEDVTECTGGARDITDADLERAYRSNVDPRLNYEQALEITMLIVRKRAQVQAPATL